MSQPRRRLELVDSALCGPPLASATASVWDQSELLQVGELARETGKTVRAIHLYEDLGLISPVRRSKGRYRLFAPDAKLRIRWISKLQSLGLSLHDIQALLEQRRASPSAQLAAAELRQVYAEKLQEVVETIERYRALQTELEHSLAFLDACHSACQHDVERNSCPSCERHGVARSDAPELIAGAQFVSQPA
jgi:MerR family transcriptional regulator, copper efflux regulator